MLKMLQLKQLDFSDWIYHLLTSFIGGGASAVVGGISAGIIAPDKFNLAGGLRNTVELMGSMFLLNGIINLFYYLKQSPLPPIVEETTTSKTETSTTTKASN